MFFDGGHLFVPKVGEFPEGTYPQTKHVLIDYFTYEKWRSRYAVNYGIRRAFEERGEEPPVLPDVVLQFLANACSEHDWGNDQTWYDYVPEINEKLKSFLEGS